MSLSQRRADAVREYLIAKGVAPDKLTAVGYGETRLVNPGASGSAQGAEWNRRVVFVIESPGVGAASARGLGSWRATGSAFRGGSGCFIGRSS